MPDDDWGAMPQDTSTHDVPGIGEGDLPAARTANEQVQTMADAIGSTGDRPGDLTDLSVTELLGMARRAGVEGCESMSKAELVDVLRRR